jgi:hypothetical protein
MFRGLAEELIHWQSASDEITEPSPSHRGRSVKALAFAGF